MQQCCEIAFSADAISSRIENNFFPDLSLYQTSATQPLFFWWIISPLTPLLVKNTCVYSTPRTAGPVLKTGCLTFQKKHDLPMLKLSGGERGEIRENPERSASLYLFLSLTSSDVTGVAAFQNLVLSLKVLESQLSKTLRLRTMFGTTPLSNSHSSYS